MDNNEAPGESSAGGRRIMIIDDEPDVVDYLCIFLEESGYEVQSTTETDRVEDKIEQFQPELLLIDIMMPRKNGLALYRDLRKDSRFESIPVLFISAFSRHKDFPGKQLENILAESGISQPEGYIEKPIDRPVLLETITSILSGVCG